uniref:F-box domain-containing protein n=1 Tax=Mycena chlorophos TaxID=658473 RepID=A0ABQ0L1U7_MYCCL|nr:predicted protein [Mycena chlorophos]
MSSGILIPDIHERIIDVLKSSPAQLKKCALVSPAFRHRAQGHLFRTVVIRGDRFGLDPGLLRVVSRLAECLRANHRLVGYIRRLEVAVHNTAQAEALPILATIRFKSLETLALSQLPTTPGILGDIQRLLSNPMLKDVRMDIQYVSWSLTDLRDVFEAMSASVEKLSVTRCAGLRSRPSNSGLILLSGLDVSIQQTPHLRLRELEVWADDAFLSILAAHPCPLSIDYSGLRKLVVVYDDYTGTNQVLASLNDFLQRMAEKFAELELLEIISDTKVLAFFDFTPLPPTIALHLNTQEVLQDSSVAHLRQLSPKTSERITQFSVAITELFAVQ